MRNVFFGLLATAFIGLSSFTTNINDTVNLNVEEVGTISCRWRTVYYHSNGDISYTEWTYGNCNQSESGVLTPIR